MTYLYMYLDKKLICVSVVYGNAPVSNAETKPEKKGSHSLIFVKPRIPQLEINPQVSKKKVGLCAYPIQTVSVDRPMYIACECS